MDDLLLQVENEREKSWRSEGRQQRQDESDRENNTILPDGDNVLDVPYSPVVHNVFVER